MKLLRYGERAVLVELADSAAVLALRAAVSGVDGVVELVPAARTLLVEFDPAQTSRERISAQLTGAVATPAPPAAGPTVRITVRYDGPDLAAVADEVGLSVAEVVRRHTTPTYTVAFIGFSPGFAYLTGLDPVLEVRRLAEPRTSVPAGAVGVAGEFTGVYPRSSPGGWRLLGGTDAPLWDTARTPPALLAPGTRVRFVPA
ncbi:MAG: Allophanate hydrolase subunit 1 [Pseudonocardiales bacterium]|nr:Allophanate hydrolase subunit 1 [Pseudonocardiales bacterium]